MTKRQPAIPNGSFGTSSHAAKAQTGTAKKLTPWEKAMARPRSARGTISEMKASIVVSSTPTPIPAINRQRLTPFAVVCNAIITVAALYQSKAMVNIRRRPRRSATWLSSNVPMNNPVKKAPMKLPMPVMPNSPAVVGVRMWLRNRPGAT